MGTITQRMARACRAVLLAIALAWIADGSMLFRDFTSSRGFRFLGSTRHNTQNKTLELISETPSFTAKLHSVCAVWAKRKVHWHEGFEIKLVFRMRNPDTTNNGGEG